LTPFAADLTPNDPTDDDNLLRHMYLVAQDGRALINTSVSLTTPTPLSGSANLGRGSVGLGITLGRGT